MCIFTFENVLQCKLTYDIWKSYKYTNIMSKTTRLADSFQKRQAANYITRSFHGNQHGPPWYLSHGDLPHTLKAGNRVEVLEQMSPAGSM